MAEELIHKQEFHIRNISTRSVTLFPTRAQIIRDIKEITLQPGLNQVVIYGLSPTVDQHSIKVEGTGSAKVTDVKVDLLPNREVFEEIYPTDSDNDTDTDEDESDEEVQGIKDLNEELKKLNIQVQEEQERINSAAFRLRICDAYGNSIQTNRPATKDLESFIQAYQSEREKIYEVHEAASLELARLREEIAKTEKKKLKLAKEIVKSNEKTTKEKAKAKEKKLRQRADAAKEKERIKNERECFWPKKVYCITINLEPPNSTPGSSRRSSIDGDTIVERPKPANLATSEFHEAPTKPLKPDEINISLSYVTHAASWSPRYDLTLKTVDGTGLLEYNAELTNTTCETWRDAKLVLSTSQATFSGLAETIPQLLPWHVRLQKGGHGDSALFSAYEVQAKINQYTGEQSQKPRAEIFGRENNTRDVYVMQEQQRMAMKKSKRQQAAQHYVNTATYVPVPMVQQQQARSGGLFGRSNYTQQDDDEEELFDACGSHQVTRARRSAPAFGQYDAKEEDDEESNGDMGFGLFDDGPAPAAAPSLTFEEGSWAESGLSTTYDAPGSKTLEPSNSTIKHKIAKTDFKNIIFSHVVIGKLRQVAFLKARIRNSAKITLLKGPLNLTLDGSFLGQGSFPRCSSGETFTLPLGVDPSIDVTYLKPTVRRSQTGIFSKEDTNVFTRSLTIRNTKPHAAIDLTVLDQVPVSEDERLKIDITNPKGLKLGGDGVRAGTSAIAFQSSGSTLSRGTARDARASGGNGGEVKWGNAVATAKKGGEVSWNVKLNPGCAVKLMLEYEAMFPGGETVVGTQGKVQEGLFD